MKWLILFKGGIETQEFFSVELAQEWENGEKRGIFSSGGAGRPFGETLQDLFGNASDFGANSQNLTEIRTENEPAENIRFFCI